MHFMPGENHREWILRRSDIYVQIKRLQCVENYSVMCIIVGAKQCLAEYNG